MIASALFHPSRFPVILKGNFSAPRKGQGEGAAAAFHTFGSILDETAGGDPARAVVCFIGNETAAAAAEIRDGSRINI